MTLQRRHFQLIADIITELDPQIRRTVAPHFADQLKRTNPNFDRARFILACNV